MRAADDRGLADRRMEQQRILDLPRADPVATALDEVARSPADDPVPAVGADRRDVAGAEPPVGVRRRGVPRPPR